MPGHATRWSLEIVVPHFSNPYFASDPTHRRPFGPQYGDALPPQLERVVLCFMSTPQFGRHAFKKAVGLLVNSSRWATDFYEENLVYLVP